MVSAAFSWYALEALPASCLWCEDTANVYTSARVFYPPYLEMGEYSCLASDVNCYNVAPIRIGANSTVSQGALLCAASHDITHAHNTLITSPIVIEEQAWVGARAYIGMGVTIGQGAVVGATASVYKNVEAWTVVGGNPANFIKSRVVKNNPVVGGGNPQIVSLRHLAA